MPKYTYAPITTIIFNYQKNLKKIKNITVYQKSKSPTAKKIKIGE